MPTLRGDMIPRGYEVKIGETVIHATLHPPYTIVIDKDELDAYIRTEVAKGINKIVEAVKQQRGE